MVDIDNVMEEMDDILSSGYGSDLMKFHKTELTKLISPLTDEEKKDVWELYTSNSDDWDEWGISMEEVKFVGKLCGVKKIKISW